MVLHRRQLPGGDSVVGAGGGGEEQVHPLHGGVALLIGGHGAPGGHHGLPVAVGAQGDGDGAPQPVEQSGGQAAHLPVADDQGPLALQAPCVPRQPLHRALGRGAGHSGEGHLGLDLLACGGGVAEQDLQHPVRRAGLPGGGRRPLHLGEDLILPPDLGAQAAGHLHQVPGGLLPRAGDEGPGEGGVGQPRRRAQQRPRLRLRPGGAGEVELRAVAGGQEHAALHPLRRPEQPVQLHHPAPGEGEGFPQTDGGLPPVQAGHTDVQASSPFFTSTTEK